MTVALEDPRRRLDTEVPDDIEDPPEADDERLSSVIFWWAIVMIIAVGSVILSVTHRV